MTEPHSSTHNGERVPKDALPVSDCSATSDPSGFRTRDLRIKSPLLYQLSYRVGELQSSHDEPAYSTSRNDFLRLTVTLPI